MTVSDMQMMLLRALLDGEDGVASKARARLTGPDAMDGVAELVQAALVVAARRKFSPTWNIGEVIRFVARVRAALSERPGLLDPQAGERELRRALGEEVPAVSDIGAQAVARLILLDALVQDLGLDDNAVWGLLHHARDNVEQHSNVP